MTTPYRDEAAALLTLLAVPRLSQAVLLELLERHGSGRSALAALSRECGRDVAAAARSPEVVRRAARALRLVETERLGILAAVDATYPELLRLRLGPAAPPVLFCRGDTTLFDATGVAVVGCRRATAYGLDVAAQIGGAVARAGGCVVSGLARGIDAASHLAALDAGGGTIAVLGCGVDVYYPRENTALQDRIAHAGLLVSEFLPGEPPRRYRFPHRNRIIAALSAAVVVVEAGERSGAIRTAEHAMEAGIATYGVPGALDRPNTQGILGLYRDGVPPYTGARDLVESVGLIAAEECDPRLDSVDTPPAGPLHARVWSAVGREPAHIDAIAAAAAAATTDALTALLELELDGRVAQLPGARFVRAGRNRAMA
ncbi:MAG TPA: DNA-processing protein DprA [Longimicrobiales bacterium]|nr:DNA-processing protein DprA [Longimicrobiales bacterium]